MDSGTSNWPIKIGQKLKRRQLHALVGGAFQWGITSCMQRSAMLVFNNPKKAREFGYDRWEGWQPNGEFHYTGQGPIGDQDIATRSNNSLLRSKARGIPVLRIGVTDDTDQLAIQDLATWKLNDLRAPWVNTLPDLFG